MRLYCVSEKWNEGGRLAKTPSCFTIEPWETKNTSEKNLFSQFLSKRLWGDKEVRGNSGKEGAGNGFPEPHQPPWLQDRRSSLPQGSLTSISLLDSEFNALHRSYGCKVLQAPRQMLGYSSWVFPRYLLKKVCPILPSCLPWYLYRACVLACISLTWEPESSLDNNPTFIESVGNFLFKKR